MLEFIILMILLLDRLSALLRLLARLLKLIYTGKSGIFRHEVIPGKQ